MSVSRKFAWAMVIPVVGALLVAAAGSAQASGYLYGAIALGGDRVGEAFDYPNQSSADQAALDACGKPVGCYIAVRIQNECGSVVERDISAFPWTVLPNVPGLSIQPMYTYGTGATAAEAERAALKSAGPILESWVVRIVKPAFVLDTICTANAR
ncbi:hypothetical protein JMUB6875_03610 [Nocardia sp. JMUB6875]|uniref:DUF4189 domain-containing protein n=1 Tax=Nocardia sp. JMUB6875 TaxID=3158170 RepID=UPI0032E6396D